MMKVGIISDTHGLLREEVVKYLKDCSIILHAGDIGDKKVLNELQSIGKVYAVRGNVDRDKWADVLPEELTGMMHNIKFYMTHNKKHIPEKLEEDIRLVIYGHSHKYEHIQSKQGAHYLNPGGCGRKRFSLPLSLIIGQIEGDRMIFERKELD